MSELDYLKVAKIIKESDELTKEELEVFDKIVTEEYNKITQPYRIIISKLSKLREECDKRTKENCKHCFTRYTEYHNESYYICNICGYEK